MRLPAEYEPHQATLIAWPSGINDWPGKLTAVKWAFAEIARLIAEDEPLYVVVSKERQKEAASYLAKAGAQSPRISFLICPTDRSWIRDYGPVMVSSGDGERIALDFAFNGWGRYPTHKKDAKACRVISKKLQLPTLVEPALHNKKFVLEGGAFDTDGAGTFIITEECLLYRSDAVKSGRTKSDVEKVFREYLGARKIIWLEKGIEGDDTGGHVDDFVRFAPGNKILFAEHTGQDIDRLKNVKNGDGKNFEIVKLPMPEPVVFGGTIMPASYANFYVTNKKVIVPTFNCKSDRMALEIIAKVFTGRRVVGLHCRDIIVGRGALHCLTMQIPDR